MPHKIDLSKIEIYSQCPKKYFYTDSFTTAPNLNPLPALLKESMKSAHLDHVRSGLRSAWRSTTTNIDHFCFKEADVTKQEEVDKAYSRSIKMISEVKNAWYDKYYLEEDLAGFTDLALSWNITGSTTLVDNIDLLLYNEKDIILCYFSNIDTDTSSIYNNIRIRAQASILSAQLRTPVTSIRFISWQDEIKIRNITIRQPLSFIDKTERALRHIVSGIEQEVFYTSVSSQCITCPFRNKCSM